MQAGYAFRIPSKFVQTSMVYLGQTLLEAGPPVCGKHLVGGRRIGPYVASYLPWLKQQNGVAGVHLNAGVLQSVLQLAIGMPQAGFLASIPTDPCCIAVLISSLSTSAVNSGRRTSHKPI